MFEERSGLVAVGELLRQWAAAREQLAKTERELADLDPAGGASLVSSMINNPDKHAGAPECTVARAG